MKKIILFLSLLLLSNITFASNYKVTVIFKGDQKLLYESSDTISANVNSTIEYPRLYIKSIEHSCVDEYNFRICRDILHKNNKDNKIKINIKVNESNELEILFDYKEYLEKNKESNFDRFETYKVKKKVELKEQETIISSLENKELKIIIEEIKK